MYIRIHKSTYAHTYLYLFVRMYSAALFYCTCTWPSVTWRPVMALAALATNLLPQCMVTQSKQHISLRSTNATQTNPHQKNLASSSAPQLHDVPPTSVQFLHQRSRLRSRQPSMCLKHAIKRGRHVVSHAGRAAHVHVPAALNHLPHGRALLLDEVLHVHLWRGAIARKYGNTLKG